MSTPYPGLDARRIIVADEDRQAVDFIIKTLREDGHAVFHAYDFLAAVQLAEFLPGCHLLISNTKVEDSDGVGLITHLRQKHPALPIVYLANTGRSTPEREARLPSDVPFLREPFTREKLRAVTNRMLDGDGNRPPGGDFNG